MIPLSADNRTPHDPRYIRALFDRNARIYDRLNPILSMGMLERWRGELLEMVSPTAGARVLDAFSGPGGLGLHALRRVGPSGEIIFADLSPEMLREARRRVRGYAGRRGAERRLPPTSFRLVDLLDWEAVRDLGPFDIVLAGWALRYTPDPVRTIALLYSLLREDGSLGLLEFTGRAANQEASLWEWASRTYFRHLLPPLASLLGGDPELSRCLVTSTDQAPSSSELATMVRSAGLHVSKSSSHFGGLLTLVVGQAGSQGQVSPSHHSSSRRYGRHLRRVLGGVRRDVLL